jgi:hypothetical protein
VAAHREPACVVPHLRFTPAAGLVLALVAGHPVTAQDPAVLPSERSRVEHRDWFDDSAADRCTFHGIHHGVGVFGQAGAAAGRPTVRAHRRYAPHDLVGKYATKGINGFLHSLAFTTGRFPNPIRIRGFNHDIIERACRECHEPIVAAIDPAGDAHQTKDDCTRCHKYVGHWVR